MKRLFKAETSKLLYLFVALVGIAALQSCKKLDPDSARGSGTTYVKLINASTDSGPVTLLIGGEVRVKAAVAFGGASDFSGSFSGDQDITVQSAGGLTLSKISIALSALTNYSFFLTGTSGNYGIIPVADDLSVPSTSTKAKVRFVQASSNLASANLSSGGAALFSAQAFKAVSAYNEVSPGAYTFTVTNGSSATVLASSASITLLAGKNYTVFTSGLSGTTGSTALLVGVIVNN